MRFIYLKLVFNNMRALQKNELNLSNVYHIEESTP